MGDDRIPAAMRHLPRHGALPIPWFVPIDKDGKPDFRARSNARHCEAVRYQLCQMCGG